MRHSQVCRLPAAARGLVAVLRAAGDVDGRSAEVANLAEQQLALGLRRSGSVAADKQLARADELEAADDRPAAERTLVSLSVSQPRWAQVFYRLGVLVSATAGRRGEGIVHLRRAVQLAPEHVFAWVALGNALKADGDVTGALAAFRQAQARHPTMAALRRLRQWIAVAEQSVSSTKK